MKWLAEWKPHQVNHSLVLPNISQTCLLNASTTEYLKILYYNFSEGRAK
jgi:hypothetical protein